PALNLDANGNPRGVSLSVGVDDRTNSLVVNCNEAMYQDVKKLIDQLELAAKDSSRTVRVVQLRNVDPMQVQRAIDAIQGRNSQTSLNNNRMGGQGGFPSFGSGGMIGGSSFSPFGSQGGFTPGGFRGGFNPGGSGFTPGGSGFMPSGGGFQPGNFT